jgi:ribosomal protein L37E
MMASMRTNPCLNCGFPNRPEARFCGSCGYALTPSQRPAAWEAETQPGDSEIGSYLNTGAAVVGIAACVIFVMLFSLAYPIFSISGRLSDPETYTQALVDEGAYEKFPGLFGEQADFWVKDLQSSFFLMEIFFRNIDQEDWELVAERIFTPEWVQSQTEGLFAQFFDYANGDVSTLSMAISFQEVKDRLGGEVGYQTYTQITARKPECNMLELSQWLLAPTIGLLPVCKLPEDADFFIFEAPDPEDVVPGVLEDWAASLPDESNLAEKLTEGAIDEIDGTFGSLRLIHTVAGLVILISLIFLGLSFISPTVRSLKGWLRTWGITVLVSGMILALMAVLVAVLLVWQVGELFNGLEDIFVAGVIELGRAVGQNITLGLVIPMGVLGGLMVVAGFGMFGASFFVQQRSETRGGYGYQN